MGDLINFIQAFGDENGVRWSDEAVATPIIYLRATSATTCAT
jgi:hypothetical protein